MTRTTENTTKRGVGASVEANNPSSNTTTTNFTTPNTNSNVTNYFEEYLTSETIFTDKRVLQSNYVPETLAHRDEQTKTISRVLAPALRKERPSNLFLYGKTGTGKTVTIKAVTEQMLEVARKQNIPIEAYYLNCKLKKVADTEYRLIAQLARFFKKEIPVTGLPTDEVYNILFEAIDAEEKIVLFVLDEIDHLIKKAGDELIYNLTRINTELKKSQVCIIGISNDLAFANNLDPRVKSSLSEEELIFPPYNALQLQTILKSRADKAFKESTVEEGVIQKCAAYAAREHGDARRALELLRVAGELADRENTNKLTLTHIDRAEERIEKERYLDVVRTQPKQSQAALLSILRNTNGRGNNHNKNHTPLLTGDLYNYYHTLCDKVNLRPLTQRRISDLLNELDMLGIITATVVSKGRFGRTREVVPALPSALIPEAEQILITELGL